MTTTTSSSLTSVQLYYQQKYQTLKNQVEGLQVQRKQLLNSLNSSSDTLDQLDVITRQLATKEYELYNLPDALHRQIDARTSLLELQLESLESNGSPSEKAYLEGAINALNDAKFELNGITDSWEKPAAQTYQVGGVTYSNTGSSPDYNFFTLDGALKGTWAGVSSFVVNIDHQLQTIEARDFLLAEQTRQDACKALVNIVVGEAVGKIFTRPADFPNLHPALQDQFWGEVVGGGVSASGDVCKFIFPADQWQEQLRMLDIPVSEADSANYSYAIAFNVPIDLVQQIFAEQSGLAAVSAAYAQGNTSAPYLVAAYEDAYEDSLSVSDIDFASNKSVVWTAWAQTLENRQLAGLDISKDLNWLDSADPTTQMLGKLVQDMEAGTVSANEVKNTVSDLIDTNSETFKTLETSLDSTLDAIHLIQAIRSGEPLPIVASGLKFADDISALADNGQHIAGLNAASSVANAALSLYNLENTLKNGDALDKVTAVVGTVDAVNRTLVAFNGGGSQTLTTTLSGPPGGGVGVLPVLSLINDIRHGDGVGAAIDVIAMIPGGQPVAVFLTIARIMFAGEPPVLWGTASVSFGEDGQLHVNAQGEGAGRDRVEQTLQGFVDYLQGIVDEANKSGGPNQMALIANRLPSIQWSELRAEDQRPGWALVDIDPNTGERRYPDLRYNDDMTPYNADPTDPEQRRDFADRYLHAALEHGALGLKWEADTARIQTQLGDPNAGLTEEERAGRTGKLAARTDDGELDYTQAHFRPVELDLDGDGQITVLGKGEANVAFDWDDTGYAKQTGWVGSGEGMLFLDRNPNGGVDSGRELFSNGELADEAKGLRSMTWVDANGDGRIDAADPVFNEIKVWQDVNGNGVLEDGEAKALAALGITELNYEQHSFTRNGQVQLMASKDIEGKHVPIGVAANGKRYVLAA